MMADNNHDSFLDIVRGSETVRERWAGICEQVVADAAARGVQIEPADVLNIREARLAALGSGQMDSGDYLAELDSLPAMHEASLARRVAQGDAEARAEAVAHINAQAAKLRRDEYVGDPKHRPPGDDPRHAAIAARKISTARELGVASAPAQARDPEISQNEKLKILAEISDPATRMAQARKWGFL